MSTLGVIADAARISIAARTRLRMRHGLFDLTLFHHDSAPEAEQLTISLGDVEGDDVLVRVHSECFTGEVLGSLKCDCGAQLDDALARIAAEGRGVVVYLRQEGRGIGLADKLRAYALQDRGADTIEANLALGLPVDARQYDPAAAALLMLGVGSVRLLTNNPDKEAALRSLGVEVLARIPTVVAVQDHNRDYLECKRLRLRHGLPPLMSAASPKEPEQPLTSAASAPAPEPPSPRRVGQGR